MENEVEHQRDDADHGQQPHMPGTSIAPQLLVDGKPVGCGDDRRPQGVGLSQTMMEPWLRRRPAGPTHRRVEGKCRAERLLGIDMGQHHHILYDHAEQTGRSPQTSRSATRPPARPFSSPTLDTGTRRWSSLPSPASR